MLHHLTSAVLCLSLSADLLVPSSHLLKTWASAHRLPPKIFQEQVLHCSRRWPPHHPGLSVPLPPPHWRSLTSALPRSLPGPGHSLQLSNLKLTNSNLLPLAQSLLIPPLSPIICPLLPSLSSLLSVDSGRHLVQAGAHRWKSTCKPWVSHSVSNVWRVTLGPKISGSPREESFPVFYRGKYSLGVATGSILSPLLLLALPVSWGTTPLLLHVVLGGWLWFRAFCPLGWPLRAIVKESSRRCSDGVQKTSNSWYGLGVQNIYVGSN